MIKLIDYYTNRKKGQIMFINKSCIKGMVRNEQEGLTRVWDNGVNECAYYDFKETPEEILAMPDIEASEKDIDWEQRKFDLVSALFVKYACSPDNLPYLLNDIIPQADALINELKKGQGDEN